jgi:hypothetical protein
VESKDVEGNRTRGERETYEKKNLSHVLQKLNKK